MNLDAGTFEISDPMNVDVNGNLEENAVYPPLECSSERESSSENGDGFGSLLVSLWKEHDWESKSWMEVAKNPSIPPDMNVKATVPISSSIRCGKMISETVKFERLFSSGFKNGGASNIMEDVENSGDQLYSAGESSNEILFLQEIGNTKNHYNTASEDSIISASSNKAFFVQQNMDTRSCYSEDLCMASPEGSGTGVIDAEEASIKGVAKPFNYMIRIPRVEDDSLSKQIKVSRLLLEEKTKLRDATQIQIQIQEKRANSQVHGLDYEYAKGENRSARKLVKSKRLEIDHLLTVINKAKNALAVEDVDCQINNMEHMIHHETLSLKEEKQLMHKKRQLKLLREQLTLNLGSKDEIKWALEQREQAEKQLSILKKELNILKGRVLKAEAAALQAGKKYRDESKMLRELQLQLAAVNDDRQVAYSHWQSLRKEFWTKNKLFFEYKNDTAMACNCANSRNGEALHLCKNQVENFMELQNMNDEFRQEHVKLNASKVWRLGTLDGCTLGHNEELSILPTYVHERLDRIVSDRAGVNCLSLPTLELNLEAAIKNVYSDDKSMEEATDDNNQIELHKELCEPAVWGLVMVSGRDVTDNFEELRKSEKEAELTRKAEVVSIKDDKVEVKLKEQRQLEELAKANEARERKKRQANKIQMRKEMKAQKEAEQKEKEREKRLRKKVRKRATGMDADETNCSGTSRSSEGISETCKGSLSVAQKRKQAQKPCQFMKQSKAKSAPVPSPLRNRNKKIYQQWIGLGLTTLVLSIVFCCVNIDVCAGAKPRLL